MLIKKILERSHVYATMQTYTMTSSNADKQSQSVLRKNLNLIVAKYTKKNPKSANDATHCTLWKNYDNYTKNAHNFTKGAQQIQSYVMFYSAVVIRKFLFELFLCHSLYQNVFSF